MTAHNRGSPVPPIRLALFGCGRISRLAHLRNIGSNPDVELVGIADPDPSVPDFVSREAPGVPVFPDVVQLLEAVGPEAVVIALPTTLHIDAAVAAFRMGAHVYLEKPVATTLDQACAIARAWRESGLVGMMGFNSRHNRLYRELKDVLAGGAIGRPVAVRTAYTAKWPPTATWRLAPATGGGAFLELASHHVDLLRFIFDTEVSTVSATSWSNRGDDLAGMLQIGLASGLFAQTLVSYGTVEEDRFEIYGSEGKLTVDRYDSLIVDRRSPNAVGGLASAAGRLKREVGGFGYGLEKRRAPGEEPSFSASLDAFVGAVRSGRSISPDLDDGLRALEIIDAANRSVLERRVIELTR